MYCQEGGEKGKEITKNYRLRPPCTSYKLVRFYCLSLLGAYSRVLQPAARAQTKSPHVCCRVQPEAAAARTRGSVILRPQASLSISDELNPGGRREARGITRPKICLLQQVAVLRFFRSPKRGVLYGDQ